MSGDIVKVILEAYGIWGLVLLIVSLIVLAAFVNYISKISIMSLWNKRKRNAAKGSPPIDAALQDSWFFTNAKFKMKFDIPSLELNPDHKGLNRVYQDLIYLNVESFYYGCKRLIETQNYDEMSGAEWEHVVKAELQSMISTFSDKSEGLGVPLIARTKYSKWLKPYTTLLNSHIEQLSNSAMYGDVSSLRMHVFLMVMNLMIVVMIGDLDKLAKEETDEYDGVTYRDIPLYN